MKKVGLVTCYFHPNYGSMLQAYATQKILDDWQIPCENIAIDGLRQGIDRAKTRFYLKQWHNPQVFTGTILRIVGKKVRRSLHRETFGKNLAVRSRKFLEFQKAHFRLSPVWHSREELTRACAGDSSVLVGSDQLWLPSNIDADYYTLTWVPDGVNKIAYATSFGTNFLPDWLVPRARAFLSRIQYLSVREKSAVEMVRSYAGLDARLVCDPTLLFTAEEWMCIQPPEPVVRGDYILCYFLGNNTADRRFACRLREKTGCKIVALLHLDEYIRADEGYADETPFDVGPGELLNLIRNARYIVTDSFYGSVFSILNRKTFFTSRRIRKEGLLCTNNRLDSLFETLGVTGRLITGEEDVEECLARPLDYEPIHRNLARLRESTSGGAFTPIAEYVLKQGGTVFGAAFVDGQWNVAHVSAATTGELARFRSSKYIQSEIRDTFAQAKKLLDQGQWVCFSGTPCQIGGLKQFLPREYDKLVTVDVECRAVPSPLVFHKCLEVRQETHPGEQIRHIRFRDKAYGYSYSTFSIYPEAGKEYHRGIESDLFLRVFFSGVCDRPSCSDCKFRSEYHRSDFTLWDCFREDLVPDTMSFEKGVSRVSVNSDKGRRIFAEIQDQFLVGEVRSPKPQVEKSYQETLHFTREEFFDALNTQPARQVFQRYFPESLKVHGLRLGRELAYRTGCYRLAKKVWNRVKMWKG